MKPILIFFQMLMMAPLFSQTTLNPNLVFTWDETKSLTFYLENPSDQALIPDIEKSELQPQYGLVNKKFTWENGLFKEFAIRNHNRLQNGDYFSLPTHWAVNNFGSVSHISDQGQVFSVNNIGTDGLTLSEWQNIRPDNVLPMTMITPRATFKPVLTLSQIQQLQGLGYIVTTSGTILSITDPGGRLFVFDEVDRSTTEQYKNYNNESCIKKTYFDMDENTLTKLKEVLQTFKKTKSGICYMEVKEVTYNMTGASFMQIKKESPKASESLSFEVYPNPTNGVFYINIKNDIKIPGNIFAKIYDSNGNVQKSVVQYSDRSTIRLSTEDLTPGVYFIHLTGDGFNATKRVTKL